MWLEKSKRNVAECALGICLLLFFVDIISFLFSDKAKGKKRKVDSVSVISSMTNG